MRSNGESKKRHALVLLSGGMDSVAALHWSRETFDEVRAVGFMYGQPHAHNEIFAARKVCERRGIAWDCIHLGESVRGLSTIEVPKAGIDNGVSRANLPSRNAIFLAVASGHAARIWPREKVYLIVGCNLNDAIGFPDCRGIFIDSMGEALNKGLNGAIGWLTVVAPWLHLDKSSIVGWCLSRPDAIDDVRDSVSCYAGTRCGSCDACIFRASAFSCHGIEDGSSMTPVAHGGDAHREGK